MNCVVTIDGPTGSGKSTVSRLLATRLNYRYLDTGAMYRAVGVAIMRAGIDLADKKAISKICKSIDIRFVQKGGATKIYLGNEDVTDSIRTPAIDLIASTVSAFDSVRQTMTRLQRKVASQGSLVAEGRDMGTVVFPRAQHKFYIDASLELRVDRRFQERNDLHRTGENQPCAHHSRDGRFSAARRRSVPQHPAA